MVFQKLKEPKNLEQQIERKCNVTNKCQFASTIQMYRGKWLCRVWAYKRTKDGILHVKEAFRKKEGCDTWLINGNVRFSYLAGYQYNFAPYKDKYGYFYENDDRFYCLDNRKRRFNCITCVSDTAIDPRLRYMKWSGGVDLFTYIDNYLSNQIVEMLGSLNIGHLCVYPSLLKKLNKEKAFRKYIFNNAEEIAKGQIYCQDIIRAYKKGWTIKKYASIYSNDFRSLERFGEVSEELYNKTLKYLEEQFEGGSRNLFRTYIDYLGVCTRMGIDINNTRVRFPKNLIEDHNRLMAQEADIVSKELDEKLKKVADKYKKYEFTNGDLSIYIPERTSEFVTQGNILNQCVAKYGYSTKMAEGGNLIIFVYLNGYPYETAEYSKKEDKFIQIRGKNNLDSPRHTEVVNMLEQFAQSLNQGKENKRCRLEA